MRWEKDFYGNYSLDVTSGAGAGSLVHFTISPMGEVARWSARFEVCGSSGVIGVYSSVEGAKRAVARYVKKIQAGEAIFI